MLIPTTKIPKVVMKGHTRIEGSGCSLFHLESRKVLKIEWTWTGKEGFS
jgi:hypothetical protein